MNFNHLLSLDRRYTKTESEIFRLKEDFLVSRRLPKASVRALEGPAIIFECVSFRSLFRSLH